MKQFWQFFNEGQLDKALANFFNLEDSDQLTIFQILFQKSGTSRKPFILSVLRRRLHDNQDFNNFYSSWFPAPESCHPVTVGNQIYQQHFPVSTRVLNGIKIKDGRDIISVGLTWVKNEAERDGLLEYIEKAKNGEDQKNEARHEKTQEVSDGELVGLFLVETDDNLGTSF